MRTCGQRWRNRSGRLRTRFHGWTWCSVTMMEREKVGDGKDKFRICMVFGKLMEKMRRSNSISSNYE